MNDLYDNQTWCPGAAARVQHIPGVDLGPVLHKLWREQVKWQWVGSDRVPLGIQLSELVKHELFSKRKEGVSVNETIQNVS